MYKTTPIGDLLKILGGNSYWSSHSTNYRNEQRHYYMKIGVGLRNNAASGASRNFFGLYPHYCDILGPLGYISRK